MPAGVQSNGPCTRGCQSKRCGYDGQSRAQTGRTIMARRMTDRHFSEPSNTMEAHENNTGAVLRRLSIYYRQKRPLVSNVPMSAGAHQGKRSRCAIEFFDSALVLLSRDLCLRRAGKSRLASLCPDQPKPFSSLVFSYRSRDFTCLEIPVIRVHALRTCPPPRPC